MKSVNRNEWANLIIIVAVALGAFVRFNPTILAGFPINDGGMFAVMVDDLKTSRYALPMFTSYNSLNIPYAYSPLGFYIGRITADLFGMDTINVLRWVPAFFASLSVPAFYLLASRLMKSRLHAAYATLFFALMPRAMSWFIMGGGLTRSPAQFFMLLTLASVVRLYVEHRRQDVFLSGLFGALAVLSHPEAALHTAVSAFFLWLMFSRTKRGFINSIYVALLVFLFTLPWWATVIIRHGLTPLFAAAQTGSKWLAIFNLVFFAFTEEPYATLIGILGLIGLVSRLARRDYLLPLWLVIPFVVEGRSAAGPAAIPLAMLAASGLVDVVLMATQDRARKEAPLEQVSSVERGVFFYLLAYLIFSAYQFGWNISHATLYAPDQEAMHWVSQNTPEGSRFLVLTGTTSVSCDSVLEWFPALADRQSIYTVQGTEWTQGANFNKYVRSTYAVQECLSQDAACFMEAVEPLDYDYVYVSKVLRVNNCVPLSSPRSFPYFLSTMMQADNFEVVYETSGVIIYRRR